MGLGKQAKTLTKAQVDAALGYLSNTRHPARNRVILLLSVKAGLRAKEIASLTWDMVTTSDGEIGTVHPPHQRGQQGQDRRSGRPAEPRASIRPLGPAPDRLLRLARPLRHRDRAVYPDLPSSDREPVLPLVCRARLLRLLQPQRDGGPSSPTPPERSRRSAARCGTFRRSPVTRTSRRRSATSSRTPRRSGGSSSWCNCPDDISYGLLISRKPTSNAVDGTSAMRQNGHCGRGTEMCFGVPILALTQYFVQRSSIWRR